jgi:hypothetical protein
METHCRVDKPLMMMMMMIMYFVRALSILCYLKAGILKLTTFQGLALCPFHQRINVLCAVCYRKLIFITGRWGSSRIRTCIQLEITSSKQVGTALACHNLWRVRPLTHQSGWQDKRPENRHQNKIGRESKCQQTTLLKIRTRNREAGDAEKIL